MNDTPLAMIDPAKLDEIFAKDPLSITDDDLRSMIAYYRARRAEWKASEESGVKSRSRAAKSAAAASPEALANLSLESLL